MSLGQSATWPYVMRFAVAMEAKLAANRHKGDREGWLYDEVYSLMGRVREEILELERAVWPGTKGRIRGRIGIATGDELDDVLHEAADVANMVMMVADRCGALVRADTEPIHDDFVQVLTEVHKSANDAARRDMADTMKLLVGQAVERVESRISDTDVIVTIRCKVCGAYGGECGAAFVGKFMHADGCVVASAELLVE